MSADAIPKAFDVTVGKLMTARRAGDAEAEQTAYEELFVLCQENDLDLQSLLKEAEAHWRTEAA